MSENNEPLKFMSENNEPIFSVLNGKTGCIDNGPRGKCIEDGFFCYDDFCQEQCVGAGLEWYPNELC
jgi:hypothetical protein